MGLLLLIGRGLLLITTVSPLTEEFTPKLTNLVGFGAVALGLKLLLDDCFLGGRLLDRLGWCSLLLGGRRRLFGLCLLVLTAIASLALLGVGFRRLVGCRLLRRGLFRGGLLGGRFRGRGFSGGGGAASCCAAGASGACSCCCCC